MRNASHTHTHTQVICCADTFSCMSHEFKEESPQGGPLCVYPGLGQCFQGQIHLYMPFLHHSSTRTHTIYTQAHTALTHTFPVVVLAEGEQQWSGTGLFFSAGQTLARRQPPNPFWGASGWDPFEPPPAGRTSL